MDTQWFPFLFLTGMFFGAAYADGNFIDIEHMVPCDEKYYPPFCDLPNVNLSKLATLEDFDRCGPAVTPLIGRNYYWGAAGRKITYEWNERAFDSIMIIPRILRDVSNVDMSTFLLGKEVSSPIGIAPAAAHKLAHPLGEIGTARAAGATGTLMILSSVATARLEDVASEARRAAQQAGKKPPVLWMQTYIYKNRKEVLGIIRRAEYAGYSAIVVTVDTPMFSSRVCGGLSVIDDQEIPNLFDNRFANSKVDASLTFDDLRWVVKSTKLPVVAKGILTGIDAVEAVKAGVSAVYVSNHGGRQLDTAPPTIEALQNIARTFKDKFVNAELYLDGGVRTGPHVFKALALGARAVFFARPALWGLAIKGEEGVKKTLNILTAEFNETMIIAGYQNLGEITANAVTVGPKLWLKNPYVP